MEELSATQSWIGNGHRLVKSGAGGVWRFRACETFVVPDQLLRAWSSEMQRATIMAFHTATPLLRAEGACCGGQICVVGRIPGTRKLVIGSYVLTHRQRGGVVEIAPAPYPTQGVSATEASDGGGVRWRVDL
jgi:hypothetical protein